MTRRERQVQYVWFIYLDNYENKKVNTIIFHYYYDYLFMPFYGFVSSVPVFHTLLAAETADTISRTSEVEACTGQAACWYLLGQAGAMEWVQATVYLGKIVRAICLQIAVLCEISHDRTRQETAERTWWPDCLQIKKKEKNALWIGWM